MPADIGKRKQSLYFPEDMLNELAQEAVRQDRSLSWVIQQAWRVARERIRQMPGTNDLGPRGEVERAYPVLLGRVRLTTSSSRSSGDTPSAFASTSSVSSGGERPRFYAINFVVVTLNVLIVFAVGMPYWKVIGYW